MIGGVTQSPSNFPSSERRLRPSGSVWPHGPALQAQWVYFDAMLGRYRSRILERFNGSPETARCASDVMWISTLVASVDGGFQWGR
jgi:hypothetical protein